MQYSSGSDRTSTSKQQIHYFIAVVNREVITPQRRQSLIRHCISLQNLFIIENHSLYNSEMAAMKVADIKIKDLLDFSLPLGASISPSSERPQSTGTVHHRPVDYIPSNERHGVRRTANVIAMGHIKTENNPVEEKCPNVCVRNGEICTPYRHVKQEGQEEGGRGVIGGRCKRGGEEREMRASTGVCRGGMEEKRGK